MKYFHGIYERVKRGKFRLNGFFVSLFINLFGGKCSNKIYIEKGVVFTHIPHEGLLIEKGVHIGRNVTIDVPLGGKLIIREGTRISIGSYISASDGITIGRNVLIGEYSSVRDADHGIKMGEFIKNQHLTKRSIWIGNDVWVGRGVIILKGINVGSGSVIGANAVVTRSTEPNEIVVGNPIKNIGFRE